MKQVLFSSIAALILTSGIASADSFLGADVSVYEPQTTPANVSINIADDVSSTFDAPFETKANELPSVQEQKGAQIFGPR